VKNILFLTGKDERQKVKRNPTFQQKGDSMQATHFITLTMAAVSLMGCNPKETVNALTSDTKRHPADGREIRRKTW